MEKYFLIINLIISSSLCTLIWIIQILHYPSFYYINEREFISFEAFHKKRITTIVMPLMLIEVIITIGLIYQHQKLSLLIAGMVLVNWLITFFVSVPYHKELSNKKDGEVIKKLIQTNWIRTFCWSSKFLVSIYMMI